MSIVVAFVCDVGVAEDRFPAYFYEASTGVKRSELARRVIESGDAEMLISVFDYTSRSTVEEVFAGDDIQLKRKFLLTILLIEHGGWGRDTGIRPATAWVHVAGWVIPFLSEEFPNAKFQVENLETHQSRLELYDKVRKLGGKDYMVERPRK